MDPITNAVIEKLAQLPPMTPPTIKDSGQRQDFDTGSKRDIRTGKGRFDLLPALAIARLAQHFEGGAQKYGDRNWEKGQPLSRYLDSAMRHTFKYLMGLRDEDHLIAACWNLMCLAHTEVLIKSGQLPQSLDDLPPVLSQQTERNLLGILENIAYPVQTPAAK